MATLTQSNTIKQAKSKLHILRTGMTNPFLPHFIAWKYGDLPVLRRAGFVYPVAAFSAPVAQRSSPNLILGELSQETNSGDLVLTHTELRNIIASSGRTLFNKPTFTQRSLQISADRISLQCGLGDYFTMLDSCDSLEWEILRKSKHLTGDSEDEFRNFNEKLPFRKQLHDRVQNPVLDGSYRSVALSISALIAYVDEDNSIKIWLMKRSSTVAVHANLIHAIPSFMFQPLTEDIRSDYAISSSIYREYLEELFNRKEPEDNTYKRNTEIDPVLQYLLELSETDEVKLYFTGISTNLYNLRPEIHTLLFIRTPNWIRRHRKNPDLQMQFRPNIEWTGNSNRFESRAKHVVVDPILFDPRFSDQEILEHAPITPFAMVPCGSAAFWFGVDQLRTIL